MFECKKITLIGQNKNQPLYLFFYEKVWDLVDHSCLASIRPKSHKINGELQACCYNSKQKTLLINTDKISFLSLKLK
jgi:hypothetical protein